MVSQELRGLANLMFEGKPVRLASKNGDPWFVLGDVCHAMEVGNVTDTAKRLDQDEFDYIEVTDSTGRRQQTLIVSEPGLYKIAGTSNKSAAKRFDRFVRHEVLPSIRKYGCYPPPANVMPQEMAALTQMFDQYDRKLDEKIRPLHDGINEINSKLKVVVDNTNKNRKYATAETERLHYRGICHFYFTLCPCEAKCGSKIADENGFIKDAWHHHHQYGPWDNRPEAMIPLAVQCHQRITNDAKSRMCFDQTAFPEFQNNLARLPVKQLTLDLKPPKD